MKKLIHALLALMVSALVAQGAFAGKKNDKGAQFGALYYDGQIVGTVATPTSMPGKGVDTIYVVTNENPAEGQLGITTVAPGDPDYHGGRWAVVGIMWIGYGDVPLFTSAAQVDAEYMAGNLTMERLPEADFVCPVHLNGPRN